MAEWDESSRDITDFGEHERTSADYFAATEDSEMEYQQRTFQHKDPDTQHYHEDVQGSDPFVGDHNTHSSQDHEEYRQAQVVPDLDHGHSYDHFESQHQQHYLDEDPTDLPANFAREPAKNEQFQMGTEDDDLEYQREQTGAVDERMDQYEHHQQEESQSAGSNPFDVADGLLAQRTVAVEEPEHSNPNPFVEQDQPYHHPPTDFDNEEIPREMEHGHDSHPEVMAAMTRGDERFEEQGDEEEDEDSDTENTADHFQYGKMEEEDATEEIPADEPDAREVPVVGIDNHAFDYQEDPARDESSKDDRLPEDAEMHQEDDRKHYEEMEHEPERGALPPSDPAVEFESSMTAAPISEKVDTTEEQSDEPRYDPHVDNVDESQQDFDAQQFQDDVKVIEPNIPEIEVCEPCCYVDGAEEAPVQNDQGEEQLISGGFEPEHAPETEPSMQAHEPQSEVYEHDQYEHNQNEDAVRDSSEISAQEFQASNIESTLAEPNRYDQVEEEDEVGKTAEKDEFGEREEKYEGQQETDFSERQMIDEDAMESTAIGAQFTQPGIDGEVRQEEFGYKEEQNSYEYQEEKRYTEEKRFDDDIQAENELKEEHHSYEYQEEKRYTEEKRFDDEMEAEDAQKEEQHPYEHQEENQYTEEKTFDDQIEAAVVGSQFTQPGFEEKMDDEPVVDREQQQAYEDQQENDYPGEKIVDDIIEPIAVGAQFTQPGFADETTSYPVDDAIDNRQDDVTAFDVEKQDEEIVKESNAYEEQTDFQTSNLEKEEQDIPPHDHGFTQFEDEAEEPENSLAAEKSNEAEDTLYTDSERSGFYQGETDNVKEEMDQLASVDQSHAPPPSSISELDSVASSLEEKKSFVDNLEELASPETIPQPLPSPPEPRTISNFDPLVPDSSSSSPPRSPTLENHEGYGQMDGQVDGLYQNEVMNDVQAEAADFLTAGEVEGETKFGVDGSAVTKSASQNNQFLTSEEEEDESPQMEYDYAKQEEIMTTATTETTTTETETSERSGDLDSNSVDPGAFEQYESGGHDNALMSMSMEGSFYDDGGDLIGGDDNHADKDGGNIMYQSAITEESEPSCSFSPRQESLLRNEQQFAEQQAQRELPRESFPEENDYEAKEDGLGVGGLPDQKQIPISQESSAAPIPSGFDDIEPKANAFDQEQSVNGTVNAQDPFGSLLDAPVTETGLQTPVTESSSTAFDSSVDVHDTQNMAPITNRDIESSSVDVNEVNTAAEPINGFAQAVDEEIIRDTTEKVESAGASTVSVVEPVPEQKEVADTASSQPPEPVAVPDAAAAAAVVPEAKSVTKTAEEKKKTKKATTATSTGTAKKTTTSTLSKKSTTSTTKSGDAATVSKSTSSTTSASARTSRVSSARTTTTSTTKKTETSSTTPRQTSPTKKPTEAKTTPAEKKTPRPASSPTKAPAKSSPLPSYAQPITPRKPREPKTLPEPATKRPATAGGTSSTRPTSSTTPRTRPTSVTTRTTTTTTSRTTTSTTSTSAARPKSSPTKLANGSHTDRSSSPTKKTGVGAKPAGEKKDTKTPSSASRGTASPATGARSPQKATSPRTPTSAGSAKSKIGSLNNANHTPGGGAVKITTKKVDYSNVTSRVGSKDKMDHKPGGGNIKIENRKMKVEAKSKVGSLDNATHKPAGGDKKIESSESKANGGSPV